MSKVWVSWEGQPRRAASTGPSIPSKIPPTHGFYFQQKLRATIQVIGGYSREQVRQMIKDGHSLKPISVAYDKGFMKLLEGNPPALDAPNFPDGWVNFYRQEDYCATAYFYLDKPVNGLPALAGVGDRTKCR